MQYSAIVAAFAAVVAVKAQDSAIVNNSTVTDATSDAMTSSDVVLSSVHANDTIVSTASVDDRAATSATDSVSDSAAAAAITTTGDISWNTYFVNSTTTYTGNRSAVPYAMMSHTAYMNLTTTSTDDSRDHRSTSTATRSDRAGATHYMSGAGNNLNAGLFGAAAAAAAVLLF